MYSGIRLKCFFNLDCERLQQETEDSMSNFFHAAEWNRSLRWLLCLLWWKYKRLCTRLLRSVRALASAYPRLEMRKIRKSHYSVHNISSVDWFRFVGHERGFKYRFAERPRERRSSFGEPTISTSLLLHELALHRSLGAVPMRSVELTITSRAASDFFEIENIISVHSP
jgi:hypothetical protein